MEKPKRDYIAEPRFEQGRFQLIAGFGARFTQDTAQDIPLLWESSCPGSARCQGRKMK